MKAICIVKLFVLTILCLCVQIAGASELLVPVGYSTIQAAINAASDGDVVIVSPGTYNENLDMDGKGITLRSVDPCSADIVSNTIINGSGAGSCIKMNSNESSDTIVYGLTFANGSSTYGGGIYCYMSGAIIANCRFISNAATNSGGAIGINYYASPQIINCLFASNHSEGDGGAVYVNNNSSCSFVNCVFTANTASDEGGAVYVKYYVNPSFVNCTIYGNSASSGGGVAIGSNCGFSMANSVLWGNGPDQINTSSSTGLVEVVYSCVEGGFSGTGNISDDPNFIDPDGDDNVLGTLDDDMSIGVSLCVDSGDYTKLTSDYVDLDNDGVTSEVVPYDFNGNTRLVDNEDVDDVVESYYPGVPAVDMGACEWQRRELVFGDFNEDFVVDWSDLVILMYNWLDSGADFLGDLDGDQDVDMADFAAFTGAW